MKKDELIKNHTDFDELENDEESKDDGGCEESKDNHGDDGGASESKEIEIDENLRLQLDKANIRIKELELENLNLRVKYGLL